MSTHLALPSARPLPGVLFGLTHNPDGSLIIRESKILKVGIGQPKGAALSVWTQRDPSGNLAWKLTRGYSNDDGPNKKTTISFATRGEAEAAFAKALPNAPTCKYPRKLPYFSFTRPAMVDGAEVFVPDFEAIEAHGPTPTEIDVVMLDDEPFDGAFQMWSSSELRCKGDGVHAMRVVKLATTDEQRALAKLAEDAGLRTYPIENGCATCGCPFALATMRNGKEQPAECKPGADLKFQLAFSLRVGGVAYFHTSGRRSIQQLFSALQRIKSLTGGRLVGIPLKMVLRPYRTNHNGQAATQYGVSLEFRAASVAALREKILANVFAFREVAAGAPAVRLIGDGEELTGSPLGAAAINAEFGGFDDGEEAVEEVADESGAATSAAAAPAAAATQASGLADEISKRRRKPAADGPGPVDTAAPAPAPPATAASAPSPVTTSTPAPAPGAPASTDMF
jgi:hypothetical protein